MNKIVPLLLFLSCLLSSCWQDVYVDWDGTPVQLSLTTRQLCADSAIQIDVQPASRDAYWVHGDSLPYYLQVELWVNGEEQGKMYIEKSADSLSYLPYATTYYTSTYIPKAGDRIGIRATCEGFEPLTAETVVPSVVPIEKLGYTYEFDTIDYQLHMAFQLTFRDNPSTADYYAYSYMLLTKDSLGRFVYTPYSFGYGYGMEGSGYVLSSVQEEPDPIVKFRPNTLDYIFDETSSLYANFFDDSDISGESYTLQFSFSGYVWYYENRGGSYYMESNFPDTLYIQPILTTMSQDYYYYNISSWASKGFLIGSLTEVGLSDPIEAYSNVEGGEGILYGCNPSPALIEIVPKDLSK